MRTCTSKIHFLVTIFILAAYSEDGFELITEEDMGLFTFKIIKS